MAGRDGGLIAAIENELISLKATTLSGIDSLDRDFTPESELPSVRLVLSVGSNRMTATTCSTEFRTVSVTFSVYGPTTETTTTQAGFVETLLWDWSESPLAINTRMEDGNGVREMRITDFLTRHEQSGVWSMKFSTEWEIQLRRD